MYRQTSVGRGRAWGVAIALCLAAALPAHAEVVNRVVATIDGEPVTLYELQSFSEQARRRAGTTEAATADQHAMLDELVLEKILHKQVEAQGVTATDAQIDAYIASIRERNHLTDAQLREALGQQGLTWEQYRAQVRTDIERAALINKEIRTKVNVSPEEVERYYRDHLAEYGTSERVHVRLISRLVPAGATPEQRAAVRAEAERIHKLAASGKDFAELATTSSEGPGAADGGDLGELARGQMQPEFDKAAFALKSGEVSEVIETENGFHILKMEKRAGDAHQPIAEVKDDIREKLYRENLEERYERWLKTDLRARYHVETFL